MIDQTPDVEEPPVNEEPQAPEEPKEENNTYKVATIDGNKKLVAGSENYKTYADAKKAATKSNQVVTFNDKIISMTAGLVISNPSTGKATTTIYEEPGFKNSMTYVPPQSEMEYIESTDQYVKVNLAGRQGYVQQSEVTLLPTQQVEKRNYYSVNNSGDLVHHLYYQLSNSAGSYSAGKAPSFFKQGEKYYSWDGGIFYNQSGQKVGTAYQYFNYLPTRTVTNYSAAELDQYINHALEERESYYYNDPKKYSRYKDATNISKLKGLGPSLKEAEKNYKVNALFMLSIAINESDFGMSKYAQERNNLFGINAVDSNTDQADYFESPSDSINVLAREKFNNQYLNVSDFRGNGAAFGNKAFGMNVRYASDPYWGQKNAGHMYRADQFLGSKDIGQYEIGVTNDKRIKCSQWSNNTGQNHLYVSESQACR